MRPARWIACALVTPFVAEFDYGIVAGSRLTSKGDREVSVRARLTMRRVRHLRPVDKQDSHLH